MTIAEKLTEIGENIPKVYDAGVKSFADKSQGYLNGMASGEKTVEVYDVAPAKHYVVVRVKTPELQDMLNEENKDFKDKTTIRGDDLFVEWVKENGVNTNQIHLHASKSDGLGSGHFTLFSLALEAGTYYFQTDITNIYCESRAFGSTDSWKKHQGKEITITLGEKTDFKVRAMISYNTNNEKNIYGTPRLFQTVYKTQATSITVKDEFGIATEYITDENGVANNVKSVAPFMKVMTPEGLLEVEYVKDIVKVATDIATQVMYEGYKAGFNALDKGEYYNQFWDEFQQYGNRTVYVRAFASIGWTNLNFKPKYNIICNGNCELMFGYTTNIKGNLKEILGQLGITMDTSKATNLNSAFIGIYNITHLPKISLVGAGTSINNMFRGNPNLIEIEELEFGGYVSNNMFDCPALKRLIATGVISNSGLDLKTSTKLDRESITSIINVLSSSVSGKSITLSKIAVDDAFMELRLNDDGTIGHYMAGSESEQWAELIATKPNWTINLA